MKKSKLPRFLDGIHLLTCLALMISNIALASPQDDAALREAAGRGDTRIVKMTIGFGAHINAIDANGGTPLLFAAASGSYATVRLLLDKGADPNPAGNGFTPLDIAAERGYLQIVKVLLKAGADRNTPNILGDTPLISALRLNHLNVAEFLLANGADINKRDAQGQTPLMLAVSAGQNAVVRALFERHADLNARDLEDRTALYWAIYSGQEDIALQLIAKGIDTRYPTHGYTPLHWARAMDLPKVLAALTPASAGNTH